MLKRILVSGCAALSMLALAEASDCDNTSVDLTPINDLGAGLYLGQFEGGLYPGGLNTAPPAHRAEGAARMTSVPPLNAAGEPDPHGKYVLLSIGMSNTTQEFCSQNSQEPCNEWTFMGQAQGHPEVDTEHLVIVNGARGGQAAGSWTNPAHLNYEIVADKLQQKNVSQAQVRFIWVKQANPQPQVSLPAANADAYTLLEHLGDIVRACKLRYPNLLGMFFSSRIYAGYASTTLNPEPYAYESAFAMKWLVEAQIDQMNGGGSHPIAGDLDWSGAGTWLAWGPYPWADGLTPRSDGLTWACNEFDGDGTHPGQLAEEKVGTMLLDFFLTSPYTHDWFRNDDPVLVPGDVDGDGDVDFQDVVTLLASWGPCAPPPAECPADLDGNGVVGFQDLLDVLSNFGAP